MTHGSNHARTYRSAASQLTRDRVSVGVVKDVSPRAGSWASSGVVATSGARVALPRSGW